MFIHHKGCLRSIEKHHVKVGLSGGRCWGAAGEQRRKGSKEEGFPSALQKGGSEAKGHEVGPQRRWPHQSQGKRG